MTEELCIECGYERYHANHICSSDFLGHVPGPLCHPFHSARETAENAEGSKPQGAERSSLRSPDSASNRAETLPLWCLPVYHEP